MVVKSFSLFGKELYRVERNREGTFTYRYLDGNGFTDNGKYLDLYFTNPVLNTIVSLRADLYSQMKIMHVDKNGKEITNSPYLKLLSTPNYFQSKEDFFYQQMVFLSTAGTDYIYQKKVSTNEVPKALYNLIPSEIDLNETYKINKFIATLLDKNAFEKREIKYTLDQTTYKIPIKDLIPTYDLANGLINNTFFQSPSRVKAIHKVLCNIEENLSSKNINLQMSKKYLTKNESTGNEAQIQPKDRTDIEHKLDSQNMVITNANIDVTHLVSNMKNLYLDEQFADDANKCLLAFGQNKDVLNYFAKDSTFENQEKGMIKYIQNSIQNTADNTMNSLSQAFGLFERGERLIASYDHLPIMQSIINEKIATLKSWQETIKIALENGTITQPIALQKTNDLMLKLNL